MIRIERGHARCDPGRPVPKVPLVDVTIIVDDERHDARIAVFGRIGDEPEAADHVALYDVVDGAAGRVRALTGQDFVVVAVISLSGADPIASLGCGRDRLAERAVRLAA